MSKVIYTRGCNTLLYIAEPIKNVTYADLIEGNLSNAQILEKFFDDKAKKLNNYTVSVIGPNGADSVCTIDDSKKDVVIKHNAIITDRSDVVLAGYTYTSCLVGLTSFDGKIRCIIDASLLSLANGIVQKSIAKFADYGVSNDQIAAYIGSSIFSESKAKIMENLLDNGIGVDDILDIFPPEHPYSAYNLVFACY